MKLTWNFQRAVGGGGGYNPKIICGRGMDILGNNTSYERTKNKNGFNIFFFTINTTITICYDNYY